MVMITIGEMTMSGIEFLVWIFRHRFVFCGNKQNQKI